MCIISISSEFKFWITLLILYFYFTIFSAETHRLETQDLGKYCNLQYCNYHFSKTLMYSCLYHSLPCFSQPLCQIFIDEVCITIELLNSLTFPHSLSVCIYVCVSLSLCECVCIYMYIPLSLILSLSIYFFDFLFLPQISYCTNSGNDRTWSTYWRCSH